MNNNKEDDKLLKTSFNSNHFPDSILLQSNDQSPNIFTAEQHNETAAVCSRGSLMKTHRCKNRKVHLPKIHKKYIKDQKRFQKHREIQWNKLPLISTSTFSLRKSFLPRKLRTSRTVSFLPLLPASHIQAVPPSFPAPYETAWNPLLSVKKLSNITTVINDFNKEIDNRQRAFTTHEKLCPVHSKGDYFCPLHLSTLLIEGPFHTSAYFKSNSEILLTKNSIVAPSDSTDTTVIPQHFNNRKTATLSLTDLSQHVPKRGHRYFTRYSATSLTDMNYNNSTTLFRKQFNANPFIADYNSLHFVSSTSAAGKDVATLLRRRKKTVEREPKINPYPDLVISGCQCEIQYSSVISDLIDTALYQVGEMIQETENNIKRLLNRKSWIPDLPSLLEENEEEILLALTDESSTDNEVVFYKDSNGKLRVATIDNYELTSSELEAIRTGAMTQREVIEKRLAEQGIAEIFTKNEVKEIFEKAKSDPKQKKKIMKMLKKSKRKNRKNKNRNSSSEDEGEEGEDGSKRKKRKKRKKQRKDMDNEETDTENDGDEKDHHKRKKKKKKNKHRKGNEESQEEEEEGEYKDSKRRKKKDRKKRKKKDDNQDESESEGNEKKRKKRKEKKRKKHKKYRSSNDEETQDEEGGELGEKRRKKKKKKEKKRRKKDRRHDDDESSSDDERELNDEEREIRRKKRKEKKRRKKEKAKRKHKREYDDSSDSSSSSSSDGEGEKGTKQRDRKRKRKRKIAKKKKYRAHDGDSSVSSDFSSTDSSTDSSSDSSDSSDSSSDSSSGSSSDSTSSDSDSSYDSSDSSSDFSSTDSDSSIDSITGLSKGHQSKKEKKRKKAILKKKKAAARRRKRKLAGYASSDSSSDSDSSDSTDNDGENNVSKRSKMKRKHDKKKHSKRESSHKKRKKEKKRKRKEGLDVSSDSSSPFSSNEDDEGFKKRKRKKKKKRKEFGQDSSFSSDSENDDHRKKKKKKKSKKKRRSMNVDSSELTTSRDSSVNAHLAADKIQLRTAQMIAEKTERELLRRSNGTLIEDGEEERDVRNKNIAASVTQGIEQKMAEIASKRQRDRETKRRAEIESKEKERMELEREIKLQQRKEAKNQETIKRLENLKKELADKQLMYTYKETVVDHYFKTIEAWTEQDYSYLEYYCGTEYMNNIREIEKQIQIEEAIKAEKLLMESLELKRQQLLMKLEQVHGQYLTSFKDTEISLELYARISHAFVFSYFDCSSTLLD